jgi:hypothetical protein
MPILPDGMVPVQTIVMVLITAGGEKLTVEPGMDKIIALPENL